MNLVEAFPDGDTLRFGQFTLPLSRCAAAGARRARHPAGGVRRRLRPGLPTIDVRVEVVEDLGSEAHVFFHVDAPPITAEVLESASEGGLLTDARALHRQGRRRAAAPAWATTVALGVDLERFHFFDAESGARLCRAGHRARRRPLTQAARDARERPRADRRARRRRRDPLRAAARHRPRRLAPDRARGARRARARGLPRPPPRRRDVRRRAEGREGHRHHVVQRRHARPRARRRRAARSSCGRSRPAPASAASCTSRRPSRSSRSSAFASPTASRWRSSCCTSARRSSRGSRPPTSRRTRSTTCSSSRWERRDRRRHADGRADGDERRGVRSARCAAPFAGAALRARDARVDGDVVEYTSSTYRGDRYRLVTEIGARRPAARSRRDRCRHRTRPVGKLVLTFR